MYNTHHYKIDFEKVKTLEDVILILKLIDPSWEQVDIRVNHIRHLVVTVKKEGGQAVMD